MLMTAPQTGGSIFPASTLGDYDQEEALVTGFARTSPTYARKVLGDAVPDGHGLASHFERKRVALQDTLHGISGPSAQPATRWHSKIGVSVTEHLYKNFTGAVLGVAAPSFFCTCAPYAALVSLFPVLGCKDEGHRMPMIISSALIVFLVMPRLDFAHFDSSTNAGEELGKYGASCVVCGLLGFLSGVGLTAVSQILDNLIQIKREKEIFRQVLATQATEEEITAQESQLVASAYVLQMVASDLELARSFFDEGVRTYLTRLKGEAEVNLGTAKSTRERLVARLKARERELNRPDADKSHLLPLNAKLRAALEGQDGIIGRINAEIDELTRHLTALDTEIKRIDNLRDQETYLCGIANDYQLAGSAQAAQTQIRVAQEMRAELLESLGNVIRQLVKEVSVNHRTCTEVFRDVELQLAAYHNP